MFREIGDEFPVALRYFVPRLLGEAKNAGFSPKNLKKKITHTQNIKVLSTNIYHDLKLLN